MVIMISVFAFVFFKIDSNNIKNNDSKKITPQVLQKSEDSSLVKHAKPMPKKITSSKDIVPPQAMKKEQSIDIDPVLTLLDLRKKAKALRYEMHITNDKTEKKVLRAELSEIRNQRIMLRNTKREERLKRRRERQNTRVY